ncbi:MAG TPA: competence protein ComK [Bacillota bacterium]|nr:competence protein ComK [Bacillota bacterium]
MLDVYAINRQTKAILCKQDLAYRTLIYEGSRKISSIHSLKKILDINCTRHGASLEGRLKFAEYVLRTSIKLPITVHPRKGIFMVPIRSLSSEKSGVISYYQIKKYQPLNDKNRTHIRFRDGTDLIIDVSFASFNMQYKKTGQLIASLLQPLVD